MFFKNYSIQFTNLLFFNFGLYFWYLWIRDVMSNAKMLFVSTKRCNPNHNGQSFFQKFKGTGISRFVGRVYVLYFLFKIIMCQYLPINHKIQLLKYKNNSPHFLYICLYETEWVCVFVRMYFNFNKSLLFTFFQCFKLTHFMQFDIPMISNIVTHKDVIVKIQNV